MGVLLLVCARSLSLSKGSVRDGVAASTSSATRYGSAAKDALGDALAAAADREQAGLGELLDAERLERPQQRVDLAVVTGHLDHQGVRRIVDDRGAEEA